MASSQTLSRRQQTFRSFDKHYDPKSVQARRDKAYEWYTRFAFPPYDKFCQMAERTHGIDISREDIDLLPWAVKNGRKRADRKAYMKIKTGRLDQDKAFLWYNSLGRPTRETLQAALNETEGIDITREDLESLPWNSNGTALRPGENRFADAFKEEDGDDTCEETDSDDSDLDTRRGNAHAWYLRLAKPSRQIFRKLVKETNGIDVTKEDVDLLDWDPTKEFVLAPNQQESEAEKEAEQRRLEKQETEQRRQKEEQEGVERKRKEKEEAEAAERLRIEQEAADDAERKRKDEEARRLREAEQAEHRLWEERRRQKEEERRRRAVEAEAEAAKARKLQTDKKKRIREREEAERVRREAEAAERRRREEKVAHKRLEEERRRREVEEAERKRKLQEEKDRRRATGYEWYKRLARPPRAVYHQIIVETHGVDVTKEDIDLLDWDPTDTFVMDADEEERKRNEEAGRKRLEEERKRQDEEENERRRREQERMRLEAEELDRKRREADETERQRRADEEDRRRREAEGKDRLRRQAEEAERRKAKEERLRREAEHKRKEAEEADRRRRQQKSKERERLALAEREAPKKQVQHSEESRFILAYRWYSRMAHPDLASFKKRIRAVPSCDVAPDDADLLPWNYNNTRVNTVKAMKVLNEYRQIVEKRGESLP